MESSRDDAKTPKPPAVHAITLFSHVYTPAMAPHVDLATQKLVLAEFVDHADYDQGHPEMNPIVDQDAVERYFVNGLVRSFAHRW